MISWSPFVLAPGRGGGLCTPQPARISPLPYFSLPNLPGRVLYRSQSGPQPLPHVSGPSPGFLRRVPALDPATFARGGVGNVRYIQMVPPPPTPAQQTPKSNKRPRRPDRCFRRHEAFGPQVLSPIILFYLLIYLLYLIGRSSPRPTNIPPPNPLQFKARSGRKGSHSNLHCGEGGGCSHSCLSTCRWPPRMMTSHFLTLVPLVSRSPLRLEKTVS